MPNKERKKEILSESLLSKESGMSSTIISSEANPDRGSINPDAEEN